MVFEKLCEVIEDIFAVERETISPETDFSEDLFADFEDMLELSMIVEEEFGVVIDDEDFPLFETVGKLVSYIEERAER